MHEGDCGRRKECPRGTWIHFPTSFEACQKGDVVPAMLSLPDPQASIPMISEERKMLQSNS